MYKDVILLSWKEMRSLLKPALLRTISSEWALLFSRDGGDWNSKILNHLYPVSRVSATLWTEFKKPWHDFGIT